MDYDLLLEIYNNIDGGVDLNEAFLNEVKRIKIKSHSTPKEKMDAKKRRRKDKVKLKKVAKKKKKKQASCPDGKVWSVKQSKCVKKAISVGLKKRTK